MYIKLTSTLIFTLLLFTMNVTTGYADDSQNNNSGYELIDAVKNNDLYILNFKIRIFDL